MSRIALFVLVTLSLAAPVSGRAHCDTLDGPVALSARAALDGGDAKALLAWIQPEHEREIHEALGKARAARKAGKEAREVADTWFLETVVRVHRAGEGAPFTGLKPAGTPVEPAVAAVDRAVGSGDPAAVEALLVSAVREGLHARWARLAAGKKPGGDVVAGRRWVAAYVPLVHWVEAVQATAAGGDAHGATTPAAPAHAHEAAHGREAEPAGHGH